MHLVGAHVQTTGGVQNAPVNAAAIGAKAFGLFTRNQRRWQSPPLSADAVEQFKHNCREYGYTPHTILAHNSYLINIGNPDSQAREKSYQALLDETRRCSQLGIPSLNIHPGSHLRELSEEKCLEYIATNINRVLGETDGVTIVLENTAGQGSNVGYCFEHLADIIAQVTDTSRIGVCLDTCHAFAAGYDLRTAKTCRTTLDELDHIVGLRYLRGCHFNDSLQDFGKHRDRHAPIGTGMLGIEAFRALMNEPRLNNIPLILETPDHENWAHEIKLLYSLVDSTARPHSPYGSAGRSTGKTTRKSSK